jgi:hypothetical protein
LAVVGPECLSRIIDRFAGSTKMGVKIVAELEIQVGEPAVVEGASPTPPFVVVFEDDGATGYFYALDTSRSDNPIVDALQVYSVASVTDRHLPSQVQVVWSQDDMKAALLINGDTHAVFDFAAQRGYCRSGFPPPAPDSWTQHDHTWDEKAEELFR